MKRYIYLLFACCLFTNANAQQSMMQDVSYPYLEKLIATAKANYPTYKINETRINAAKAAVGQAKAGYLNFLTFTYIYNPRSSVSLYDNIGNNNTTPSPGRNNGLLNGYQLGVFLNAGALLQRPFIVRGAKEQLEAARLDREVSEMGMESAVKQRYYSYVQATNILKLRTKTLSDAEDMLKNIKFKFEKGEVTFDAYNSALISLSSYSQDKITAEANVLIAKANLEELLGTNLENIK